MGNKLILMYSVIVSLVGCTLSGGNTPVADATYSPEVIQLPDDTAALWTDELHTMSGICFEAALDAAEQVFVLRDEEELEHFYDLADNSHLCARPAQRHSFDFEGGRILAGFWSYGHGCTAYHSLLSFDLDHSARRLSIHLRFVTEGNCDYELVRPFWIGIGGLGHYEIHIEVE